MAQLVSILIPAFNAEKWIRASMESALEQTWPRKEVIVVDDGSRDATLALARSRAASNVQVLTQENRGASAARNRALAEAQGDYIQWLDADDLLARDKIARQMEGAEAGGSSRLLFSGSWGRFYHCPQQSRFRPTSVWQDLEPAEWLYRKIEENLWMAIESWLVSRRLTEMAGAWNESLSLDDDGEYFRRVIAAAARVRFVAEARCFCRTGNVGSISHGLSLSEAKLKSQATSLIAHIHTLRALEDTPRTRAACLKLLQRWAVYYYPEQQEILDEWRRVAAQLGGSLEPPVLPGKYRWLQKTVGWSAARRARDVLSAYRSSLRKHRERLLCLVSCPSGTTRVPACQASSSRGRKNP